ncbi:MAG: hypothetical protein RMK92_10775, partial [Armatimonadota bacterium]|nr:hypothetical protein [Armatimonadota bacterium]
VQNRPRRVAVLSSSGVDNDFRSWGEYDSVLVSMGWEYDKFRNTELPRLFERARQYDLVLTTSLWNYGDPQDMRQYIPDWKRYLQEGGIVVLTDMAYPPMCDWLRDWDEGLAIRYADASRDLGEKARLDLSHPSPFLSIPHSIGALNYWAHFPQWGRRYQVWARTQGGTALGLVAGEGKGALIVTTFWALGREMLENVHLNARSLHTGLYVWWSRVPREMAPGVFQGELTLRNLWQEGRSVGVQVQLRRQGRVIARATERVALSPLQERKMPVRLPCAERGEVEAVALYNLPSGEEPVEAVRRFTVSPLLRLQLQRTRYCRSDQITVDVRLAPPAGRRVICSLGVYRADGRLQQRLQPLRTSGSVSLAVRSLPPGKYQLRGEAVVAGRGGERAEVRVPFEVLPLERPPSRVRVGRQGELLVEGKPFFPIGTYHVGIEDLGAVKALGFNCVTSPIYGGEQEELTPDQRQWHDEARRQSLWVLTELSEYIRAGRRNLSQAKGLVSQLRLHPATLVHYAIDEPLGGAIGVELVQQFCALIRQADPDHPTFVNEVPGAVAQYAQTGDIIGTDPYPVGADAPASLLSVGNAVGEAVRAARGRPVWGVIQAHRLPPAHSRHRYPTPEEVRCMAYLALNHGAKGLLFYAWGDVYPTERGEWESGFKFNQTLQRFFPQFNRELERIGMHYVLGRVRRDLIRVEPQEAPLDAVWIERGNTRMAVIVNHSSQQVQAKVLLPVGARERTFEPFEVWVVGG